MRKFKLFIMAASMVALFSCSTIYTETIDEESSLESQTRSETSQNDSTQGGGVTATVNSRETVSGGNLGAATETPSYVNENDSIPNDSIPSDSIPNVSTIFF